MEEEDQDVYVAQLREVFDSCDTKGDGFLTKDGLIELCQKLQLEDQVSKLLAQLLGDSEDGEVNFEEFKEGFVIVLSDAIDGLTASSGEELPQEIEEPPKLVVNEKRYGRRSRPFDSKFSDDASADEGDIESISGSRPGSPDTYPTLEKQRRVENGEIEGAKISKEKRLSRVNSQKLRRRESLRKRDSIRRQESFRKRSLPRASEEEILEASGQISSNTKWSPRQSVDNSGVNSPTEEQQLRTIWNEVNVGANGFLDKHELSVVCEHIGMEGMDEEELSLLFDELDDDHDGQVSFEEFLHGLFIAKDKSQSESDPPSHSEAVINQIESPRGHAGSKNHGEPLTSTMSRAVRTIEANLLQALDPENVGMAKLEDIRELWLAQENTAALQILKHAEVDSEGKVSLSQLTALLESTIYEKSDSVCQAVVSIFKHELTFMRTQVESLNVEKEKMIENASNLVNEKTALIRESEDHTRQLELQYETKLKKCEEAFNEKLQLSQQQLNEEHEKAIAASSKRILELEGRVERYKSEELRTKQRIGETEEEISRLDSTLNATQESLEESEKIRTRLEKELENVAELTRKLAEVESQRDLLKQQQSQHTSKGIRELEKMNRELRDENDELQSQVELLKSQAKSGVKRNRSHRRRTTDRISRVGSVLSDYTKPVIIKRNKDGVTSSEESEHDLVDGNPPVVRVSGDGGSNEDEKAAINSEQQKTIEDLERKLTENERKIKDLENTIRQQEQNIKAKDGSINKQKTNLEKLKAEAKDKDAEIKEKGQTIETLNGDLKIKEEEIRQNQDKLNQLQSAQKESQSIIRDNKTNMRTLKAEIESLKGLSNSESSELKDRFNKELGNLTSQFTAEMEEMQQRFSSEKEEIEQEFQLKYKELGVEYERKNAAAVSELQAGFCDEKELLANEAAIEKAELEDEFQKQKQMLEKFYKDEKAKEKSKHSEEVRKLEEVIDVLREEKKQLQTFFEKEKVNIGQQFAAEKAEIEQEKAEMEKRFSDELEKERERFVSEKTNSAADYEEVKKGLEEKFNRDKVALEKNFERQKLELLKTVEELRQVFTRGQDGLKGKLREDFLQLVSDHKKLLDNENVPLVEELESLRKHSERHTDELKRLMDEIASLENELQEQMDSSETARKREREILELEMSEKLEEHEETVRLLSDRIESLTEENVELKERASSLERESGDGDSELVSELENARCEIRELNEEIEKLREQKGSQLTELEDTVENLRAENKRILENRDQSSKLLDERVGELERENARLKRLGDQPRGSSWKCSQLEKKVQALESENREFRRSHTKTDTEQKREIQRLKAEVEELQDLVNRRNEKVILAEKARTELCSLERTVEGMEEERKVLESSLHQQNIKNTSLQDEIADLKRRQLNAENRFKKELEVEKEKVNLVKTEMSTARSKYLREIGELNEKLDRAHSKNERDQSARDKILNDAKVEILTLSDKLEEKGKHCRDLEEERSSWEERVRVLDRQRREMELRIKKTQDSVDQHVTQLSKQLHESQARTLRTDNLVQELYIENARLTKTIQEVECAQKKAEKSNRQLQEQKRALQRVISKLCGANALA